MEESLRTEKRNGEKNGVSSRIGAAFQLPEKDVRQLSPLTLAYIGDAVYELVIRTVVVKEGNAPVNRLNRKAVRYACAKKQSEMISALQDELTDEEKTICRRGRNATPHTKAKNASTADYRRATAFEAVIGYLYLLGREERILQLVRRGVELTDKKDE